MQMLSPHRFIRALLRQPVDRVPIWIMRQAGRYLPEYRELRAQAPDFLTFCKTPELAVEATLQPLRRFQLDAAIVFSDILVIPEAMGMQLEFVDGKSGPVQGPIIHNPIRSAKDVEKLNPINVEQDLSYVLTTIQQLTKKLDSSLPLIGFAGSPWTCATYMVEGSSSKTFQTIRTMVYQEPKLLHDLLQRITTATIDYLNAQIASGADALMLFDTWGGILSYQTYQPFSLAYLQQIASRLHCNQQGKVVPLIFFSKGCEAGLELMVDSGCDAVGLDANANLALHRKQFGQRVAFQGNLDPWALFGPAEDIKQAAETVLQAAGPEPGFVFNLGHGIDKNTPIEGVSTLIDTVHNYKY